jgi:N-acylneuraminate cytidylyltransferase
MYHDAGQFYFFQVKSFLENNQLLNENTGGLIISELEGQDIDNENDWKLAEMKFKLLNEKDL